MFVVDVNECNSNPCKNGGTCTDRVNEYTCKCRPGYSGSNCKTSKSETNPGVMRK